jgi:hypothetical protein
MYIIASNKIFGWLHLEIGWKCSDRFMVPRGRKRRGRRGRRRRKRLDEQKSEWVTTIEKLR